VISALPLPYPFELTFMQRALVASVVVGAFAPMIGTFLVQKRMSLIGDGIGHLAFAGVGAGLVASVSPVWTALLFAVIGALGIEWLRSRRRASGDLALALFFYSGIALGVVLVSRAQGLSANILTYLFGQPLTASVEDVRLIVLLGLVIIVAIVGTRRVLFAVVTDEDWSRVAGLPVGLLNSLLAVLTASAVVAAMKIVGILLVAAMMVLPVASGQLLARSFRGTLLWSTAIGVVSAIGGLSASRVWDLAPSGTIVLISALIFAMVAATSRLRGTHEVTKELTGL
jgi:zinc transport system permease protein